MSTYIEKYSKESKNNPQFNLCQHRKIALEEQDTIKLAIIERLENEIEKLLLIKKIREDQELLKIYQKDINNAMQEGSYNLIEMILLKEIELLEIGDFEAIDMLNKLKKKADEKINKLSEIALQMHQTQLVNNAPIQQIPNRIYSKPAEPYKPTIQYEGYHLEKTLGGEIIQTLDPELKNLVGNDIINSKPEQLSQKIINEIKDLKHGLMPSENNNSSVCKKNTLDLSHHSTNNHENQRG
jgi:hypothetical protein